MKRLRAVCAAAAAALALTGCTGRQSIEELLRAPQPNEAQSAVQAALTSYLGEPLQLKYPRGGSEMAPLLFTDLDGDGEDEAAALYVTEAKGTDVHLAILENRNGGWQVVYEITGLGSEVASVEEACVLGGGTQLIVGYANTTLTDKYLAVYNYGADTVDQLYTCAYTSYIAQDLFDSGGAELAVVLPVTQASVDIAVLGAAQNGLDVRQTISLGESFVSCDGLYVTRSGGMTGLVADGASSDEGRVTDLYVVENGYLVHGDVDAPALTLRSVTGLDPTDFAGDGALELPTQVTPVNTLNYARRFYFVTWRDLLGGEDPEAVPERTEPSGEESAPASGAAQENLPPESASEPEEPPDSAAENLPPESVSEPEGLSDSAADSGAEPEDVPEEETGLSGLGAEESELEGVRFGVYDSLNGYFLRLPLAWRGGIVLADGALRGDWLVRDAGTNEVLVSVKAVDRDETVSSDTYVFAGVTEEKKVYVSVPSRVDETAARIITGGFSLMQ